MDALKKQYESEKADGDRLWRTESDLYAQDRSSMESKAYAGLGECFSVHDIVITQSQGAIHQQADEHLSSSDIAIVRARRMLDEAAQAVAAEQDPRGVIRDPEHNHFHDMVVITAEVDKEESEIAFCERQTQRTDLYQRS